MNIDLSNILPSFVRTVVPIIYGFLIQVGVGDWFGLDGDALKYIIAVVVTALIYLAIRILEHFIPAAGILLGYVKMPEYESSTVVATKAAVKGANKKQAKKLT